MGVKALVPYLEVFWHFANDDLGDEFCGLDKSEDPLTFLTHFAQLDSGVYG